MKKHKLRSLIIIFSLSVIMTFLEFHGFLSPVDHFVYNFLINHTQDGKDMILVSKTQASHHNFPDKHVVVYHGGLRTAGLTAFFIFAAGILLLAARKPYLLLRLITFAGIIAAAGISQWLLFSRGYFVPLSGFYVSIPLLAVYAMDYNYMTEYRAHRYMTKAFEHYVSRELLQEMRNRPGMLKLGGEKREISVLFSDIRNFTSIAESIPPEKLVAFLHVFFNTMTEIIHRHHGVVDKFIGDAIMAIFGAPVPDKSHAEHGVSASMDMIKAMDDLKQQALRIIGSDIAIGIGINSGTAIVGNMGSDKRFDYTAIGDTVNLASRLEGLNKFFGSTCIISDMTKKSLGRQVPLRQMGIVRVKGKTEGVMLYEVMPGEDPAFLKDSREVWRLIRNGDMEHAQPMLKHLLDQRPDDKLSSMLSYKVQQALSLGAEFDPVIEMHEK